MRDPIYDNIIFDYSIYDPRISTIVPVQGSDNTGNTLFLSGEENSLVIKGDINEIEVAGDILKITIS